MNEGLKEAIRKKKNIEGIRSSIQCIQNPNEDAGSKKKHKWMKREVGEWRKWRFGCARHLLFNRLIILTSKSMQFYTAFPCHFVSLLYRQHRVVSLFSVIDVLFTQQKVRRKNKCVDRVPLHFFHLFVRMCVRLLCPCVDYVIFALDSCT